MSGTNERTVDRIVSGVVVLVLGYFLTNAMARVSDLEAKDRENEFWRGTLQTEVQHLKEEVKESNTTLSEINTKLNQLGR